MARGWPAPLAWVKTATRTWRPTCKAADQVVMGMLFPEGTAPVLKTAEELARWVYPYNQSTLEQLNHALCRRHAALASFFDGIPPAARAELLRFPEKRWQLLNLYARCPGALELSQANPALALALACNRAFHRPGVQRPFRAARSLLPKPQRQILSWLGFPASEAACRLLRKVAPEGLTVARLLSLRKDLADPALHKLLAHLPVLHGGILRLIAAPHLRPLANPAFLADLARRPAGWDWRGQLFQPLWETQAACELLGEHFVLAPLKTLDAFLDLHQALAARIQPRHVEGLPAELPPPPFFGHAGLQPLATPADLVQEGRDMGHCVASHLQPVLRGEEAIYRVLEPIRATLSLERTPTGWRLGQVRGRWNGDLPAEVVATLLADLMASGSPDGAMLQPSKGEFYD